MSFSAYSDVLLTHVPAFACHCGSWVALSWSSQNICNLLKPCLRQKMTLGDIPTASAMIRSGCSVFSLPIALQRDIPVNLTVVDFSYSTLPCTGIQALSVHCGHTTIQHYGVSYSALWFLGLFTFCNTCYFLPRSTTPTIKLGSPMSVTTELLASIFNTVLQVFVVLFLSCCPNLLTSSQVSLCIQSDKISILVESLSVNIRGVADLVFRHLDKRSPY